MNHPTGHLNKTRIKHIMVNPHRQSIIGPPSARSRDGRSSICPASAMAGSCESDGCDPRVPVHQRVRSQLMGLSSYDKLPTEVLGEGATDTQQQQQRYAGTGKRAYPHSLHYKLIAKCMRHLATREAVTPPPPPPPPYTHTHTGA